MNVHIAFVYIYVFVYHVNMCAYIHTLYAYVYRIYIQITYALQLYACVYRIYIQIINACVCIYLHLYVYMYAEYICKLYKHMYRGTHYMCICIQNITYLNVNRNENTFSTTSTGFYTCIFTQNFVYVYDTIRFITLLLRSDSDKNG